MKELWGFFLCICWLVSHKLQSHGESSHRKMALLYSVSAHMQGTTKTPYYQPKFIAEVPRPCSLTHSSQGNFHSWRCKTKQTRFFGKCLNTIIQMKKQHYPKYITKVQVIKGKKINQLVECQLLLTNVHRSRPVLLGAFP